MRFTRLISVATLGGAFLLALAACGGTERSTTAKISGGSKDQLAQGETSVESMQKPMAVATDPANGERESSENGDPNNRDSSGETAPRPRRLMTCLDLKAFVESLRKIENRTFVRTTTLVQVVPDLGAPVTGRDYEEQADPDLLLEAIYSDQMRREVLPIFESISTGDILKQPEFQVATQADCSSVGLWQTSKPDAESSSGGTEQARPLRAYKIEKAESHLGRAGRSLVISGVNHREVIVFHVPKSNFGFRVTHFRPSQVTHCAGDKSTQVIVRKTTVYTAATGKQPPQPMIDQEFLGVLIKMVSGARAAEPELMAKSKLSLPKPRSQKGDKMVRHRNQVPVGYASLAWLYNELGKKERLTKPKSCTPQEADKAKPSPAPPEKDAKT